MPDYEYQLGNLKKAAVFMTLAMGLLKLASDKKDFEKEYQQSKYNTLYLAAGLVPRGAKKELESQYDSATGPKKERFIEKIKSGKLSSKDIDIVEVNKAHAPDFRELLKEANIPHVVIKDNSKTRESVSIMFANIDKLDVIQQLNQLEMIYKSKFVMSARELSEFQQGRTGDGSLKTITGLDYKQMKRFERECIKQNVYIHVNNNDYSIAYGKSDEEKMKNIIHSIALSNAIDAVKAEDEIEEKSEAMFENIIDSLKTEESLYITFPFAGKYIKVEKNQFTVFDPENIPIKVQRVGDINTVSAIALLGEEVSKIGDYPVAVTSKDFKVKRYERSDVAKGQIDIVDKTHRDAEYLFRSCMQIAEKQGMIVDSVESLATEQFFKKMEDKCTFGELYKFRLLKELAAKEETAEIMKSYFEKVKANIQILERNNRDLDKSEILYVNAIEGYEDPEKHKDFDKEVQFAIEQMKEGDEK